MDISVFLCVLGVLLLFYTVCGIQVVTQYLINIMYNHKLFLHVCFVDEDEEILPNQNRNASVQTT